MKANVDRIVAGLAAETAELPLTALGVTPGWLRSERMLAGFGVTEETWRDACRDEPGFAISESPTYVARGLAALAADPAARPVRRPGADLAPARGHLRRHRHRRLPPRLLGPASREHGWDAQDPDVIGRHR